MKEPKAIIFDLYGTLLDFKQKAFIKELAYYLNISPRLIAKKLLSDYLRHSFKDNQLFVMDLLKQINLLSILPTTVENCLAILDRHLNTITLYDHVKNTLNFLKARGYKLGLLSNLASPFKAPIYKFNLDTYFDYMLFSCDCSFAKPNLNIYKLICYHLDVNPNDCLFIGDSLQNDYYAPIKQGMRALLLGQSKDSSIKYIANIEELAWSSLTSNDRKLIYSGQMLTLGHNNYLINDVKTLHDNQAGRYNIIAKAVLQNATSLEEKNEVYIKRFALAGATVIEKLAYDIYSLVNLSNCKTDIVLESEPVLLTSAITGEEWHEKYSANLAYQVGQHAAMAYIFAYADFRPRNAIIQRCEDGYKLRMVDMEHCFFNIALDLTGLKEINNPDIFNNMSQFELERRRKRIVLSAKHGRRARQTFLPNQLFKDTVYEDYKNGWQDAYEKVKLFSPTIEDLLKKAIKMNLNPIIGTHAYRRAMAIIDVEDILSRMKEHSLDTHKITL